ncbi:J domain-containing protein [Solitalea koreensis]|uniref:DnaJ domain-containing protein n=1 Tax=Solitalea koreensis TaxID=543615 RepID=A0A521BSU5_9SPHI|nr:J domain-containing protein [Solitalea koreensis]SMO49801.1 DnaJ domain-containing protein [Solitalea koreensis]
MKNYYQILGLSPEATNEEIKKAYRFYATKFHPDKHNGDKFFEERFKEILEAYEFLSNSTNREKYTQFNRSENHTENIYQNKGTSTSNNKNQEDAKQASNTHQASNNSTQQNTVVHQNPISDFLGYPIFFIIGWVTVHGFAYFLGYIWTSSNTTIDFLYANLSNMWPLILGGSIAMIWYHFQD